MIISFRFVLTAILLTCCYTTFATTHLKSHDVGETNDSDNQDLLYQQTEENYRNGLLKMLEFFGSTKLALTSINTALTSLDERLQRLETKMDKINTTLAEEVHGLKADAMHFRLELSELKQPQATTSTTTTMATPIPAPLIIRNECGGTVQVGREETVIEYLPPGGYKDREFCIWTLLRTESYSGLTIEYDPYDMEAKYDGVTLYNWDSRGIVTTTKIVPSDYYSRISLSNPYAAITFSSDGSETGRGFRVTIKGTGHLQGDFTSTGFVLKQTEGNFSYPGVNGPRNYRPNERVAVVVQSQLWNETLDVSVDFTDIGDDLLKVYQLEKYYKNGAANHTGTTNGSNPDGVPKLLTKSNLPRLFLFHSNNNSNTGKGFSLSWKAPPHPLVVSNECGGTIQVGLGGTVIDYKPPGRYQVKEFCVWMLIPAFPYSGLSIAYVPYQMEEWYDGVNIYNWDGTATMTTTRMSPSGSSSTISLTKPFAAIAFSSDGSGLSEGFKVTITGTGNFEDNLNHRSFVFNQTEGFFSYPEHFGLQNFDPNEILAFVFQTYNNTYKTEVSVDWEDIGHRSLVVYELPTYVSGLQASVVGRANTGIDSNLTSSSKNPTMLLFHSSSNSNIGTGFSVSWEPEYEE